MSNALLCNETSDCDYEGSGEGPHNNSFILGDILSSKLLEANFEGKSVRAYTHTMNGEIKCMQPLVSIQFSAMLYRIINWSYTCTIVAAIIIYGDMVHCLSTYPLNNITSFVPMLTSIEP